MQNISFGGVLKVNAPYYVANKVIKMAQRKEEQPVDKKLAKLLDGCKYAHPYSLNENESYIFTGKDGKRYWKSYCAAWDEMQFAIEYYNGDQDKANAHIENAWNRHKKEVAEIINAAGSVQKLDVCYDEDRLCDDANIKSINFLA